jgi:hypothetical protein
MASRKRRDGLNDPQRPPKALVEADQAYRLCLDRLGCVGGFVLGRLRRLANMLDCNLTATMNDHPPTSILDIVTRGERLDFKPSPFQSIESLAYSEPHPSGIAAHVFEAHEAAKAKSNASGSATVQVSVNFHTGAIELIPESRTVLEALKALGASAKITIKW